MKHTARLLFALCLFVPFACKGGTKGSANDSAVQSKYTNYNRKAQRVLDSLKLDKKKLFVFIDKSDYTLYLKVGSTVVKSYPVVLGFNPVDDKKQEGDGATPEGTFKVISKYPHKSWSKFIWFDYPNDDSKRKFAERKKSGEIKKDAKIGGEVGIHGVPKDSDNLVETHTNWTLGCISLKIADINEIYEMVEVGTSVVIQR